MSGHVGWGCGGRVDATLAFECPTCKAGEGDLCVYVTPNVSEEDLERWPYLAPQVNRAGKPTKVPHQARYAAMHTYYGTQSQAAKARAHTVRAMAERDARTRAMRDLIEIRDAMRRQDARDYNELHAWLRQHAHILCT